MYRGTKQKYAGPSREGSNTKIGEVAHMDKRVCFTLPSLNDESHLDEFMPES